MKEKIFYHLECVGCGTVFKEEETVTRCLKCGESLDVIYDYEFIKRRLNIYALKHAPISATKYVDFYPIKDLSKIISLKEGGTPLYHSKNLCKKFKLNNVYIKNEGANPTGVFKDRGTLVEITKALEMEAKAICLASSGNMAASCAAYATLAKIPCYVMVPEGTPIGKLSQTISYGARVLQIRSPYSRCAELAAETAKKHNFYLAGDYVFRGEGQKSQAFEILEQLDMRVPDYVIVPVGCGTNMAAIAKGFFEYKKMGFVKTVPKMIGVEPIGCAPVYEAFKNNEKTKPWPKIETVCSAVAISSAVDGNKLNNLIKESGGEMIAVSDEETLMCEQLLAKEESIFVEPSSALSVAAFKQMADKGIFKPDDVIVISTTGNGLKDPITALKFLAAPATLDPDASEIDRYLEHKLYNLRATKIKEREIVIFEGNKLPDVSDLGKFIEKKFGIVFQPKYLQAILEEIQKFIARGKTIVEEDLQRIIETTLQEFSSKEAILLIKNYEIQVSKKLRPKAKVVIEFLKEEISADAEGVGPVDALILAIRKGISHKDKLECQLLDYEVKIHEGGTHAAVEVRIKAKDKNNNEVVGTATSPDIIEASIEAFLRAYNGLHWKN